ncbi:MAG: hypothetical protein U9Q97_05000 [Acidobacteriota bacterium]|nr:hypothetical protein [Acidobacteriota bacterium]
MLPPNNLPTLIGISKESDAAIAKSLNESLSLEESLTRLSHHFLVRAHFSQPIRLLFRGNYKTSSIHTFRCLFISTTGNFCYGYKRNSHRGRPLYGIKFITKIEFLENPPSEFKSYEDFKARFDPQFIKEEGIKSLWNSKSSMHGGKYNRNDFKSISKRGREVLNQFLTHFTKIHEVNEHYTISNAWENEKVLVYKAKHYSDGHYGRDISISTNTKAPYIFYSSEYPGCLNGHYGLLVNKSTYLYLEKD